MPTIIQEDAPHPQSYRPDLPLRSELAEKEPGYEEGYSEGHDEGYREGHRDGHDEGVTETTQVMEQKIEPLVAQLADVEHNIRELRTDLADVA